MKNNKINNTDCILPGNTSSIENYLLAHCTLASMHVLLDCSKLKYKNHLILSNCLTHTLKKQMYVRMAFFLFINSEIKKASESYNDYTDLVATHLVRRLIILFSYLVFIVHNGIPAYQHTK